MSKKPSGEWRMAKSPCAFTLPELLVVIAIIVVLAGLLFPTVQSVLERAKRVQAKSELIQIVTGVNAFYTEYGRYPLPSSVTADAAATYGPSGSNTENGDLMKELRGISSSLNTRQIVFINPPDAKDQTSPRSGSNTTTAGYYDPWGTEYAIAMDGDYDNQITPNPYGNNNGAGASPVRQGAISWSLGRDKKLGNNGDGKFTNSDDVTSWQ